MEIEKKVRDYLANDEKILSLRGKLYVFNNYYTYYRLNLLIVKLINASMKSHLIRKIRKVLNKLMNV
jgi:hypothetical protein